MSSSILRSIYRRTSSCNWAARSGNWAGRRKAKFVGSPMSYRSPMSTLSDGISSAAAAAPWLMLPPSYEYGGNVFSKLFRVNGKMDYKFYSPAYDKVVSLSKRSSFGEENKLKIRSERKAVVVGSSHGWIAFHKSWYNLDLFLYNPISHRYMKLPSVTTIPLSIGWRRPIKVILSHSLDPDDEQDSIDDSNPCRAILCFGERRKMAFCCPGRSTEWTVFGSHHADFVCEYEDFVYSTTQKQLFCVTRLNDFDSWDLGDPTSLKLNWKKSEDDFIYNKENYPLAGRSKQEYELKRDLCNSRKSCRYLVFAEHSNQLFLVRRYIMKHMSPDGSYVYVKAKDMDNMSVHRDRKNTVTYKTVGFDVHEIDREEGELRYMDGTLDGMAFFIGSKGHGFVVESPETMNLKPNSIYFTDPDEYNPPLWYEYKEYSGHDIGIFDYGNRTFSPCYYPCDIDKVERIHPAPMWFTPSPSSSSSHV